MNSYHARVLLVATSGGPSTNVAPKTFNARNVSLRGVLLNREKWASLDGRSVRGCPIHFLSSPHSATCIKCSPVNSVQGATSSLSDLLGVPTCSAPTVRKSSAGGA